MTATNERARVLTALGWEVQCARCEEFWPEDREFFYMKDGKAHSWCKACYRADEKIREKVARWQGKQRKTPLPSPDPGHDFGPLLAALASFDFCPTHNSQRGLFSRLLPAPTSEDQRG